ncbi:histone H1-like repetitive region-containing protein [Stenotrophomonas pavanii]|uniref:histone H1-like repetitive region-containing protein n=1 Tax=Stenotrophomonas pavanii TaxID=487698 RepID=UPI002E772C3A|nr:histone H1-like repetitive region-containing protein [Stenotrophomonas pavanii]
MTDFDYDYYVDEARRIFEGSIGARLPDAIREQVGPEEFLSFVVGKASPLYVSALNSTQMALPEGNPYRGRLRLRERPARKFPGSLEANCLLTLLTRSTRTLTEGGAANHFVVPYVPFQNREDHVLAQAATHIVLGRRGVGKSTLIVRARDLLSRSGAASIVLDMQVYSASRGSDAIRDVASDIVNKLRELSPDFDKQDSTIGKDLAEIDSLLSSSGDPSRVLPRMKRVVKSISTFLGGHVFVFLDDYHVVDAGVQPALLHFLNGAMKGASGWLKVAGVRSLINHYSAAERVGLQVPGDAQEISLDLTLENPEAAERHLRAILSSFLGAVGYSLTERVIPEAAFKRLVWANAGVPRDFLQMFARALEHSQRNGHSSITVSDVNIAIGEFGQKKFQEMRDDARGDVSRIDIIIKALERYCLDINKINAFLLKSEDSEERDLVRKLSDLRLVHLIHQSITPDSAGEKYEAFIVDYALFTGFRRRPNVREMIPKVSQFKASDLRKLPKVEGGFLDRYEGEGFEVKRSIGKLANRSLANKDSTVDGSKSKSVPSKDAVPASKRTLKSAGKAHAKRKKLRGKAVATKSPARIGAEKRAGAKKVVGTKKALGAKVVAKKAAAKKAVAKKVVAKKVVAKKVVAKKVVAKKAVAKKVVAKKAAARKVVAKKAVARKDVAKRSLAKKSGSRLVKTSKATGRMRSE